MIDTMCCSSLSRENCSFMFYEMRRKQRGRRSVGRKLRRWRGERREEEQSECLKQKMNRILWGGEKTSGWSVLVSHDTSHFITHTHTPSEHFLCVSYCQQLSLITCISLQSPTCSRVSVWGFLCKIRPSSISCSLITNTQHKANSCSVLPLDHLNTIVASHSEIFQLHWLNFQRLLWSRFVVLQSSFQFVP